MSLGILIPLSIALGLIGLAAFVWALHDGQFDDPLGAAWRIIPEDRPSELNRLAQDKPAPDAADLHISGRQ